MKFSWIAAYLLLNKKNFYYNLMKGFLALEVLSCLTLSLLSEIIKYMYFLLKHLVEGIVIDEIFSNRNSYTSYNLLFNTKTN